MLAKLFTILCCARVPLLLLSLDVAFYIVIMINSGPSEIGITLEFARAKFYGWVQLLQRSSKLPFYFSLHGPLQTTV